MSKRLACLVLCASLLLPGAAEAVDAPERRAFELVNRAREARDLRLLRLSGRLSRYAERHATRMAKRRTVFHSALSIEGFDVLGEIVGSGGNVRRVHRAFLDSRTHREAVLGRWRVVGIGVVRRSGTVYVVEIFAR
jgi:uncharacterized protein YkwD